MLGLSADADPLLRRVSRVLDARLDPRSRRPVAVALSGGGDSAALLRLAAAWAAARGRRLLALTVDHRLNPASAAWTARAGEMARAAGADWRALAWTGERPAAGLPAAARAARHRLLAEAARAEGARVVLLGHTASDVAEGELMRADAAPGLGRLREWGPSPAWPEGRGLALLRPLLGEGRRELRAWLAGRGGRWIEDPANADLAHPRVRARTALARGAAVDPAAPPPDWSATPFAVDHFGVVALPLDAPEAALAAAVACAAGSATPPRADAVRRLREHAPASATLAGARLVREGDRWRIGREPGRRPPADLAFPTGATQVFDGRFEAFAENPGWRVGLLRGRLARLSAGDRAAIAPLPAGLRPGVAAFVSEDGEARLADGAGLRMEGLVGPRLALASGATAREAQLA